MEQNELAQNIEFLQSAINSGGNLPSEVSVWSLVTSLIDNFASTDPYLRDELSFRLLVRLILDNRLTLEQGKALLRIAMDDEHLFYRIGERDPDAVFMRSFSVLLVPLLIATKNQSATLPADVVQTVTECVLRYAQAERDWRGYVPGKGWAHSVAHTADALMAVAPTLNTSYGVFIFDF